MRCAPHIKGQYIRDKITDIVTAKPDDWFYQVKDLLDWQRVPPDQRMDFYNHAKLLANN